MPAFAMISDAGHHPTSEKSSKLAATNPVSISHHDPSVATRTMLTPMTVAAKAGTARSMVTGRRDGVQGDDGDNGAPGGGVVGDVRILTIPQGVYEGG